MEMDKFYESQFEESDETIDDVGERVPSIGYYPEGRLKGFISLTHLDKPTYTNKQDEQLRHLLSNHQTII